MTALVLTGITSSLEDKLLELNKQNAIVKWNSNTLIMTELFPDGIRRKLTFQGKEGFLLWQANNVFWEISHHTNGDEKRKRVKVGPSWIEWEKRRQYLEVVFEPGTDEETGIYNLWRGFTFEPEKHAGTFDIFLDHLRVNVCGEDDTYYAWLLGWIADLFQRPNRKLGVAVVLRGEMGVGKGVVAQHIGAMMHRHYFSVTKSDHVTGRFNAHLADKILLFLDEAFWGGNKEAEGTLKALVTENEIPIEMKGKDLYRIRSYLRLILSTNNDWAVPSGMKDERRFAIFDVGDKCRQDKKYFAAMERELLNGGYQALMHFFMNYKYDPDEISVIPKTEALLEQKLLSMDPHFKWFYNCLDDGSFEGNGFWPIRVRKDKFYSSYLESCKNMNVRHPVDKKWLVKNLTKRFEFKTVKDHQTFEGWEYNILSLAQVRANFEEMIGHKINWMVHDE